MRTIEKSMTIDALRDIVPQNVMDRAFEDYDLEEANKYTTVAKALFFLACDELKHGSIRAVLMYTGLATAVGFKISKKGKRFLSIAYGGRL